MGKELKFKAISAWLFCLMFLPLTLCVCIVFLVLRLSVCLLSKCFRPDLREPMSSLDLSFCADSFWTRPLGANAFIWRLEGPLDLAQVRLRILATLSSKEYDYSRLRSRQPYIWMGFPFWKDTPNFSLDNHITILTGETFNGTINPFILECLQRPFERDQPLWDIFYLEGENVFILRVHHVAGDGQSMLVFLHSILDQPEALFLHCPTPTQAKRPQRIKNFAETLLFAPLVFIDQFRIMAQRHPIFTRRKIGKELVLATTEIPLSSFRRTQDPGSTHFVASLPLNNNSKLRRFGNAWTHGLFKLPLESCLESSWREITLDCRYMARLRAPQLYPWFVHLHSLLPYCVLKWIRSQTMGCATGLTNLAGPKRPVFLTGQRVLDKFAVLGLQWPEAAMSFGFFSYNDRMTITLLANKEVFDGECAVEDVLEKHLQSQLELILKDWIDRFDQQMS
ncbi:unnamed protein product [Allacma fusca]|uniref:O-acyltransferase WSD1 C-terminal domain-containing protein n=1 Tax=Allacma fusca TaxID=39272 RepID=A0A8J2J1R6_9HEXA|nr:unnamed protein product [Allacma fusca]